MEISGLRIGYKRMGPRGALGEGVTVGATLGLLGEGIWLRPVGPPPHENGMGGHRTRSVAVKFITGGASKKHTPNPEHKGKKENCDE